MSVKGQSRARTRVIVITKVIAIAKAKSIVNATRAFANMDQLVTPGCLHITTLVFAGPR